MGWFTLPCVLHLPSLTLQCAAGTAAATGEKVSHGQAKGLSFFSQFVGLLSPIIGIQSEKRRGLRLWGFRLSEQ